MSNMTTLQGRVEALEMILGGLFRLLQEKKVFSQDELVQVLVELEKKHKRPEGVMIPSPETRALEHIVSFRKKIYGRGP